MKINNLIPFSGTFTNVKALLHDIASDETMTGFVIITNHDDGNSSRAQINMTRADMAYASIELAAWAREKING